MRGPTYDRPACCRRLSRPVASSSRSRGVPSATSPRSASASLSGPRRSARRAGPSAYTLDRPPSRPRVSARTTTRTNCAGAPPSAHPVVYGHQVERGRRARHDAAADRPRGRRDDAGRDERGRERPPGCDGGRAEARRERRVGKRRRLGGGARAPRSLGTAAWGQTRTPRRAARRPRQTKTAHRGTADLGQDYAPAARSVRAIRRDAPPKQTYRLNRGRADTLTQTCPPGRCASRKTLAAHGVALCESAPIPRGLPERATNHRATFTRPTQNGDRKRRAAPRRGVRRTRRQCPRFGTAPSASAHACARAV